MEYEECLGEKVGFNRNVGKDIPTEQSDTTQGLWGTGNLPIFHINNNGKLLFHLSLDFEGYIIYLFQDPDYVNTTSITLPPGSQYPIHSAYVGSMPDELFYAEIPQTSPLFSLFDNGDLGGVGHFVGKAGDYFGGMTSNQEYPYNLFDSFPVDFNVINPNCNLFTFHIHTGCQDGVADQYDLGSELYCRMFHYDYDESFRGGSGELFRLVDNTGDNPIGVTGFLSAL